MSSIRNGLPRKAHKERSQPLSRKKFGLLEKHKDYQVRAKAYHLKEQNLQKLREKAAFRNPDEFYHKMIRTKTVDGVHKPESNANRYTQDELMLMKTQDMGYILQKSLSEKKKVGRLSSMLHSLGDQPLNRHVYYAGDREEAKQIQSSSSSLRGKLPSQNIPAYIKRRVMCRKTEASYRESWKLVKRGQMTWKSYTWTWPSRRNYRKKAGNANFERMRLFLQ
ncbi:hypothetical protein C5167_046088 [Papaver somniferum]|uniref:U3 small nucleolar RNA-associated protein 11 n=1 Tax=Papaver somniferum TaxID=3469 RepID=A0A4Y7LF29_PAPSO|nr:hypothetical protein C5167_046088 [Papaver somniferum]